MKHYIWAALWAAFVLVLTCAPMESTVDQVPKFEGIDKLVHTGFFFVFSVLLFFASIGHERTTTPSFRVLLRVFSLCVVLGVLTEYLQYQFFVYRSADVWDLFADLVGTCMGLFSYLFLHRFSSRATR